MKKFKKNIIATTVGVSAVFCVPGMAIAATNETKLSNDGTSNVNRGIMRYKLWAN